MTFGVFNRTVKIQSSMLAAWANILRILPNSRLLVLVAKNAQSDPGIYKLFADHGIASDHLRIVGSCSRHEYLSLHHHVDIGLDTSPFNGMITTFDSLWMGVPIVTVRGKSCVSRTSEGILSALGLFGLIADTPKEYAEIVVATASDLHRLRELRKNLRDRMRQSLLMDYHGLASRIETAFRDAWENWCRAVSR